MLRVVIDTNVLVSGLRSSSGAAHQVLRRLGDGPVTPVLSVPLAIEYEAVLKRRGLVLGLSPRNVDEVVNYLCKVSEHRSIWFLWRPLLPDPKDDMLLELAVEARCDAIVTFNTRHFALVARFGLTLLTPGQLLQRLERYP